MEWSKSAMSKAELEKKQREFMEQAVRMAKKAGHGAEKNEMAEVSVPEPEIELPAEEIEDTAEEAAEEIAESAEELAEETEEITEELSEVFTEEAEDIAEEPPVFAESGSVKEEHAEETSYGVFDADELARAIEKGEVSGEGLRQAAEMLAEEGISARVIDMHTVKPIDGDIISLAANECGAIVTAEEHSVIGGFGSAVCEALCESCPVPVIRVGVEDAFGRSGSVPALLEIYGLTSGNIAEKARKCLELKKK